MFVKENSESKKKKKLEEKLLTKSFLVCPRIQETSQIFVKTLPKKRFIVRPENWTRRKKRKKSRVAFAKLFGLKAKTISPKQIMVLCSIVNFEQF